MNKKKKERIELWLEFEEKDFFKVLAGYHYLQEQLKSDQSIPSSVINEFISCFKVSDPDLEFRKRQDDLIKGCHKYLAECGYDFNYKIVRTMDPGPHQPIPGDNTVVDFSPRHTRVYQEYSLMDLLEQCFFGIVERNIYKLRLSKNEIVKLIYDEVNNFNSNFIKKKLKTYKKYVITGVISSSLGLIDSKEKYSEIYKSASNYNKFLYDQVRNTLKKSLP